jgi:selenocysteine lyase/cysteine desulfurase
VGFDVRAVREQFPALAEGAAHFDGPGGTQRLLAGHGVNAPAGSFYAVEASRRLGLGDAGAVRLGIAPYNDQADVDRAVAGIAELANA